MAAAARGDSLEPYITRLNEIRRAHPALQQLRNIAFHQVDNDQIIAYSKTDPATGVTVQDEITGGTWQWGQFNYVRLEPWHHVAHIFRIER